jgi:2-amino-4-hydroxy-6-hydroxymethyldihydropteridine diphosphokinase
VTAAVLSIGSNVGDRLAHLQSVVDGLGAAVTAVSPVYETDPWGGVEQQAFYNAVVLADDPALDAKGWLQFGRRMESEAERVREQRWGPRTLDVDVISCRAGDTVLTSADPELVLPHPRAHERAFVLVPWLAVDPDATLEVEGRNRTVRDWLDVLSDAERAGVRVADHSLSR